MEHTVSLMVNTTFAVGGDVLEDFRHWAREVYIPAAKAFPGTGKPMMLRIAAQDPDQSETTFAIQFTTESPEIAVKWLEEAYPSLLALFFESHTPEQLPYFTSVMEVVE